MGEVSDDLHVQCVIVGEILLGTLDRVRDELISDGELRLYKGAGLETGRRQVVEYLITMYYRTKVERGKRGNNVQVKKEILDQDVDDSYLDEPYVEPLRLTKNKAARKRRPATRKRGRPPGSASKTTDTDPKTVIEPKSKVQKTSEEETVVSAATAHDEALSESDNEAADDYGNHSDLEAGGSGAAVKLESQDKVEEEEEEDYDVVLAADSDSKEQEDNTQEEDDDWDARPPTALNEGATNQPVDIPSITASVAKQSMDESRTYTVVTSNKNVSLDASRMKCGMAGCKFSSPKKKLLIRHHKRMHAARRYNCDKEDCRKAFAFLSDLKEHKVRIHTPGHRFVCSECDKALKSREAMATHQVRQHGFPAKYQCDHEACGKGFISKTEYSEHINRHGELKLQACTCGKRFMVKSSLYQHRQRCSRKAGEASHRCGECGNTFKTPSDLKQHEQKHSAAGFKCDKCGKHYTFKNTLYRHMKANKCHS